MTSRHLMLGFPLKSSRHPAGALPVFEGVPGDDPPSAEADGRNDALFQHRVDRDPPDGEPLSDFGNRHSAADVVRPHRFAPGTSAPAHQISDRKSTRLNSSHL